MFLSPFLNEYIAEAHTTLSFPTMETSSAPQWCYALRGPCSLPPQEPTVAWEWQDF